MIPTSTAAAKRSCIFAFFALSLSASTAYAATTLGDVLSFAALSLDGGIVLSPGADSTGTVGGQNISLKPRSRVGSNAVADPGKIVLQPDVSVGGICVTGGGAIVLKGKSKSAATCGSEDKTGNNPLVGILTQAATDLATFESAEASTSATQTLPAINLKKRATATITDSVVGSLNLVSVPSISLGPSSTLTLSGGPSDLLIVSVAGNLTVGPRSQILLTGGLTAARVIFSVKGTVKRWGSFTTFNGTLLARESACSVGSHSTINGALVCAKSVTLALSAQLAFVPSQVTFGSTGSTSSGTPLSAMGLAVSGVFAPPPTASNLPTGFPVPGGGFGSAIAHVPGSGGMDARVLAAMHRVGGQLSRRAVTNGAGAVTAAPSYIAAFAPLGSYSELTSGVALILIAGSGFSGGIIATPDVVNSCSATAAGALVPGSSNPEAVCVANGTDIYLIDGTTLVNTLTSGGTGSVSFSGGGCTTCGVVVDAESDTAVMSVATADGFGGYQMLNLADDTLSGVILTSPNQVSESFGLLPISSNQFLILSPSEDTSYDLFDVSPPGSGSAGGVIGFQYANPDSLAVEFDTGASDSTGIVLGSDENAGDAFIADLTQATVTLPSSVGGFGTWNAPAQDQIMPEVSRGGAAVAYGAHVALFEEEFGSTFFGALQLPVASGSTTPAFSDWVAADMPDDPSGSGWSMPLDPHGLTAAFAAAAISGGSVGTSTPRGIGLLMNDSRTFVAVIDLNMLLAAPRSSFDAHSVDPSYDLIANNVVTFVAFPP